MNNKISNDIEIYQFRIYLSRINPLIWRRILLRSDTTIADFHYILQIAFGWSDTYLHQFVIRGKCYGISWDGGISFSDNPHKVKLKDFHFHSREKFFYEYNFYSDWRFEIRMEKTLPFNSKKVYPVCIGGARAAPPEDCSGPKAFLELKEKYSLFYIEEKLYNIPKTVEELQDYKLEIYPLGYWLNIDKFDRSTINKWLKMYGKGEKGWEEAFEED